MKNKYLIILYYILCFILTGCVKEQPVATPTMHTSTAQHMTTPQVKEYVCTGEYNKIHHRGEPFTVDLEGNFYMTYYTIDSRMNIEKYNSHGKYITGWVPEIKKRKKNCWFSEKKYSPNSEELTDIFADKENIYLAYGAAYGASKSMYPIHYSGNIYNSTLTGLPLAIIYSTDYTGHIEQFDLNGNFITAIKPKRDSFPRDFVRYITKDKNGNFYLASPGHIEKYDSNWKLQSVLYPFEVTQKWYKKKRENLLYEAKIGDLTVDSEGYIYILLNWWGNDENGHFAKFDSSGKLIKKWIAEDRDKLYFGAIEIDPDDNLYVLSIDVNDIYHIQKFDSSGNFITEWTSQGMKHQRYVTYNDMKIDSKGNVYVDSDKGNIKKFSPKQ